MTPFGRRKIEKMIAQRTIGVFHQFLSTAKGGIQFLVLQNNRGCITYKTTSSEVLKYCNVNIKTMDKYRMGSILNGTS